MTLGVLIAALVLGRAGPPPMETIGAMEHVFAMTDRVLVGPAPKTDLDLEALHERGVRSIISVDALPTISGPPKFARVHLPLGYGGVSPKNSASLAKAIRDLKPPVYVHCHRGVHRAPTAAAIGLIGTDRISVDDGLAALAHVGTSKDYPGLWAAVRKMRPMSSQAIERLALHPLQQIANPGPTAKSMAAIDRVFERLSITAAADAALLRDAFRQLAHAEHAPGLRSDFEGAAAKVEALELVIGRRSVEEFHAAVASIESACTACHRAHRNRAVRFVP
jgi:protein tyrosine phosphatase (PTP) superfamily phosphohydrolase (DUF442 family)